MKNYDWGIPPFEEDRPLRVCLMVSRKKDNKDLEGFTERRKSFVTYKNKAELESEFEAFVNAGIPDEFCRMYLSVNARDEKKVKKELIKLLIDDFDNPAPVVNMPHLMAKVAGLAAKKECAAEKKWMIDFDSEDTKLLREFLKDLNFCEILSSDDTSLINHDINTTPHGYAIVVDRGFDARILGELLFEKWKDVATLKRDDLLCVDWGTK